MKQFFILCAIVCVASAASVKSVNKTDSPIKENDVKVDRYEIVLIPKTWSDASIHCHGLEKRLVIIENSAEEDQLAYLLADKDVAEAWTGGRGDRSGEIYVWPEDQNKPIDLPVTPICVDTFLLGVKLNRHGLTGVPAARTSLPFICEINAPVPCGI